LLTEAGRGHCRRTQEFLWQHANGDKKESSRMRFDLGDLEQSGPISVLAMLECDLNDLDYKLSCHLGAHSLPAYALAKIADILKKRALAADALARVKNLLLSAAV
jgi:hypothetical protein